MIDRMNLYEFLNLTHLATKLVGNKLWQKNGPFVLIWSLTNRCNLDCSYCGLPRLKDSHLDLIGDELLDYLQKTIDEGLKIVSVTGGEPMLHPTFEKFVDHCHKNNVLVSLNTNGYLVEKNIHLIKKKIYQVVISLDGIETDHDLHRGKGSFAKAMQAIEILKKNEVNFHTTCVVTKDNLHKMEKIADFAKTNGFKISFQPVTELKLDGNKFDSELELPSIGEYASKLRNLKNKLPRIVKNPHRVIDAWEKYNIENEKIACKAGYIFARIRPNGDMNRCGRVGNDIIPYEDVKKNGLLISFLSLQSAPKCIECGAWNAINLNTLY